MSLHDDYSMCLSDFAFKIHLGRQEKGWRGYDHNEGQIISALILQRMYLSLKIDMFCSYD